MTTVSLEDIVSLCKRRGFIYQGSDVYGGLAGTWDYGPLGVKLKRNIMQLWWKMFVEDADNVYGVDSAILMNKKTWEASGHVHTFTDPLVECSNCHNRFREDEINSIGCPNCGKEGTLSQPKQFNMMFVTEIGPTWTDFEADDNHHIAGQLDVKDKSGQTLETHVIPEKDGYNGLITYDKNAKSYLRPETAQGIFTNFRSIVDNFYPEMPFGIAQQGKAFRNEISPRDFVFRAREFEQMEIEYFVHPDNWESEFDRWVGLIHQWCDKLGLPNDLVHELEVSDGERAHYSKRTIDFEFDFPNGRHELLGLAYRTDFDLKNIEKMSGRGMEYKPKNGDSSFVPHVIEPSFGVERAIMAVLTSAFVVEDIGDEKRLVLKLPTYLSPERVAVFPLLKNKPELVAKAQQVYSILKTEFGNVVFDDNGNIGKRYRRQDEIGTPYCVTVDFQTLEDDTVTVRDRDTALQERFKISNELITKIKQ